MSITKRADNSWTISVYIGRDSRGKRIYKYETYYCRTKTEAQKRERELKSKYEITIGPANQLENCTELIDKWLQFVKGNGIEDTTYKSYENNAKMAKKIIGDLRPYTLTEDEIRERLLQVYSYYSNARTIKNIYVTIRRILKWGSNSKRQYCPKDLMEEIKNPKAPKIDRDLLDISQLKLFLDTAKQYKHYIPLRILAMGGLRIGEVLGLKWRNVDLEKGELRIIKSFNSRCRIEKGPKTKKGYRTIRLDDETLRLLTEEKEAAKTADNDYVFMSDDGEPLRHQVVMKAKNRILKRAGLQHIRLHDLRHGVTTILLENGEALINVASMIGDKEETLLGTYAHGTRKGDMNKMQMLM